MFDRKKYKNFSKVQLKGRWGIPIIMTIIILVVNFLFTIPNFVKLFQSDEVKYFLNSTSLSFSDFIELGEYVSNSTPFLVSLIQGIVSAILEFATINVYIKMTMSPDPISFSNFLEGLNNWARAIFSYLWKYLWLFLWTVLTVPILSIPAIIKSISYSQIYFIVSENKEISIPKALKVSMLITKGHKMDLFIMYLSFAGWGLLSTLTFGIGLVFLTPYMQLTSLNAYHYMLQEAIEKGHLHLEDLSE